MPGGRSPARRCAPCKSPRGSRGRLRGRSGAAATCRRPAAIAPPCHVLGALLGEERAQRGVEAQAGRDRGAQRRAVRDAARTPIRPPARGTPARAVSVGEIVADHRGDAARPEQAADDDADGTADRHILDAQPPTLQPTGTSRLNRTTTVTVNAAWPTANGAVAGRVGGDQHGERERHPQRGRAVCRSPAGGPRRSRTRPRCLPSARSAVDPVEAAFVRSTDSVPSTTQNPCWTLLRSAIATAAANASAPRRLLMNQTERRLACRERDAGVSFDMPVGAAPRRGPWHGPNQRRRASAIPIGTREPRGDGRVGSDREHRHRDRVSMERELRLARGSPRRPGSRDAAARCSARGIVESVEIGIARPPANSPPDVAQDLGGDSRAARGRPALRRAGLPRSCTLSTISDVHHSSSSTALAIVWSAGASPVGRSGVAVNCASSSCLAWTRASRCASVAPPRRTASISSRERAGERGCGAAQLVARGRRRKGEHGGGARRPMPATSRPDGPGPCRTSRAMPPAARRPAALPVTPAAALGPATPAKNTVKVTGTVTIAASAVEELTAVPIISSTLPTSGQAGMGDQLVAARPGEADQDERRERAERREQSRSADCRSACRRSRTGSASRPPRAPRGSPPAWTRRAAAASDATLPSSVP